MGIEGIYSKKPGNVTLDKKKVTASIVKGYIRQVNLNDKFMDTWVAEGIKDEATRQSLARTVK